jgi:uncharacterized phage protein gp47/JayE
MANSLFALSENQIYSGILNDLVDNTNLTRASPGSKTRAIAFALSKQMGKAYQKFDINIAQSFVDGASGKYLEFIGELLNVSRIGNQTASASVADKVIKFYVDAGTFGSINSGNAISLPANTLVSTGSAGGGIAYKLPYSVILSADDSTAYVTAQSVASGSGSNVGRNQLIYHDFIDYTDVANDSLKVINESEIIKGQDIEPEANYRYRIVNKVLSSEAANLTAIRLAVLQVSGVSDAVILPYYRGIGSFEVLIKATTPSVPAGLIAAVQEAVEAIKAYGNLANVRGPQETGVSLTGTLTAKRRLSASDQNTIIQSVTNNVIDYINNLDIGEDFIQNEVIERVMATSAEIKNLGTANNPFDNKFIYKSSRLNDNKVRSTLIGDYTPVADEKLLVELSYAGSSPILFRFGT